MSLVTAPGPYGGGSGGGGGGSCPITGGGYPTPRGFHKGPGGGSGTGSCPQCCQNPTPPPCTSHGCGASSPCGSQSNSGMSPNCANILNSSGPGSNQAVGFSPLVVNYTIDLSQVPADARIVNAYARYYAFTTFLPFDYGVTDDYGTAESTGAAILHAWPPGLLNAAVPNAAFSIRATCEFAPGISANFIVQEFTVCWEPAVHS